MTDSKRTDWQETLAGEMLLFNLVGRIIYTYPDDSERTWYESLIVDGVFSEAPFASENKETEAGLKLLQKWGQHGLTDDTFKRVQADFTRMFIGPGKVIAAPWESVYFSDEKLTFQKQTLEVRDWYRRFGLEADRIRQEPDDHIGLEMLFLAHLATLGIQAMKEKENTRFDELLEAQREFFTKHLGAWGLTWCGLVEKHAQTDFYKGVAKLMRGSLSALADVLEIKLGETTDS